MPTFAAALDNSEQLAAASSLPQTFPDSSVQATEEKTAPEPSVETPSSSPQNQAEVSPQVNEEKVTPEKPTEIIPPTTQTPIEVPSQISDEKIVPAKPIEPAPQAAEKPIQPGDEKAAPKAPLPSNQAETFTEKPETGAKILGLDVTPKVETPSCPPTPCGGYTVNFEDISVVQLIRFISQISETNFIYSKDDVKDIKVTIVSDEPASTPDLLTALVQVLRMHGLSVLQEGRNVLIFKTDTLSKRAMVVTDENILKGCDQAVITRVFRLYNLSPDKVSTIIKPFLSKDAVIEVLNETRHLIVSDINGNIQQVQDLLTVIDTPNLAMDIAEYTVKNGTPEVLVSFAKDILNPLIQGNPFQLIPQPQSRKIFIVTTPYLIHKAISILDSLDTPEISEVTPVSAPTELSNNQIYVYRVRYRKGSDISAALHSIASSLQFTGTSNPELVSAIYSIQNVEMNNTLIVVGSPDVIDKVVQLITDLDTAPKQVYLEVLIIDTTMSNSLDFGVEWIALANEQSKLAFASGLLQPSPSGENNVLLGTPAPAVYSGARNAAGTFDSTGPDSARGANDTSIGTGGDIPLDAGFGFGIVGNILRHNGLSFLTLGSLIKAIEQDNDTVIVLNPRIMVQDMQEANLFVGSNIPYQTTNTIIRDTGSVTQNYQYEDVGVQLRVTPQIGPDNTVILQIDQSTSSVTPSSAALTPTTDKTLTSTRVHVPDGCFLVMSGHIRDDKEQVKSGIPCLGSLPYIGPAFSHTQDVRNKKNLIMFVQPHIVSDPRKDGMAITNEEGYNYNWESHPSSMIECDTRAAPEMQVCPPAPPEEPVKKENINLIGP